MARTKMTKAELEHRVQLLEGEHANDQAELKKLRNSKETEAAKIKERDDKIKDLRARIRERQAVASELRKDLIARQRGVQGSGPPTGRLDGMGTSRLDTAADKIEGAAASLEGAVNKLTIVAGKFVGSSPAAAAAAAAAESAATFTKKERRERDLREYRIVRDAETAGVRARREAEEKKQRDRDAAKLAEDKVKFAEADELEKEALRAATAERARLRAQAEMKKEEKKFGFSDTDVTRSEYAGLGAMKMQEGASDMAKGYGDVVGWALFIVIPMILAYAWANEALPLGVCIVAGVCSLASVPMAVGAFLRTLAAAGTVAEEEGRSMVAWGALKSMLFLLMAGSMVAGAMGWFSLGACGPVLGASLLAFCLGKAFIGGNTAAAE